MNVSAEALRTGVFDAILEKEGLSFAVLGNAPRNADNAPREAPALDIILVGAVPAQLEGVIQAIRERPRQLRPFAIYTAPQDNFLLDWLPAMVGGFRTTPSEQPPPVNRNRERPSRPTQAFAWRAPQADPKAIDALFPLPPKEETAADTQREDSTEVKADQNYLVIFLLYRDN
jgi:hypothetical protein